MTRIKRPPVFRWIGYQCLFVLAITAVALMKNQVAAYSALLGGAIFLIPHAYFTYKAFAFRGARAAHKVVMNFYQGETSKIILIAAMFAVSFKLVNPLDIQVLFATFIATLITNGVIPLVAESSFSFKKSNGHN